MLHEVRVTGPRTTVAEAIAASAPASSVRQRLPVSSAASGHSTTAAPMLSCTVPAPGPVSEPLYDAVCAELERLGAHVERGRFGADMAVESLNDGPITMLLDSPR